MSKQSLITFGAITGVIVLLIMSIVGYIIGVGNKGIQYEETISQSSSNISKEKARKYSVFTNMVDAIESYNKYEGETLTKIIEARKSGDIREGQQLISALTEQYPELKSQENYKTYLTEVSITENRIANYVEDYNKTLRDYNAWSRKFPTRLFYSQKQYSFFESENAEKDIDGKLFNQ